MENQSAVVTMLEGDIERLNRKIESMKEELDASNKMVGILMEALNEERRAYRHRHEAPHYRRPRFRAHARRDVRPAPTERPLERIVRDREQGHGARAVRPALAL